jgi:hypothetical protein
MRIVSQRLEEIFIGWELLNPTITPTAPSKGEAFAANDHFFPGGRRQMLRPYLTILHQAENTTVGKRNAPDFVVYLDKQNACAILRGLRSK